jgi:hypothetical protein
MRLVDRTSTADPGRVEGTRNASNVYAVVLHQMAFSRGSREGAFDSVKSHYAVLRSGTVLYLHRAEDYLYASNGFNRYSVAIEFEGNFRDDRNRWWSSDTHGRHQPTAAQILAGRELVTHLRDTLGLTHVYAHRQAKSAKPNCPGPQIWYNVGDWAVRNLGLSDGGAGFAISTGVGHAIPNTWRDSTNEIVP